MVNRLLHVFIVLLAIAFHAHPALGASSVEIDTRASAVLDRLYSDQAEAKALADKSAGILVMPRIIKGGAGVDGSIAVIEFGVGKEIDTNSIRDPKIAFVFDNKGLMYNLSLEGSKFWQISK